MTNRREISVAICTFNGAGFVRAQLDSIAAQSRPPDEVVICDDRSDDDTISIIRDFAASAKFPVRIEINQRRLGPLSNFSKAIGLCHGDIVFLSDQDDIWKSHKIVRMLGLMDDIENRHGESMPVLVHSDLEVVGPALEPLDSSFMHYQGIAHEEDGIGVLLMQNIVTGCASAFNRRLIELALPVPEDCMMHDWWFALIASTRGEIGYIPEPLIRYRQHGENAVGAKRFTIQPLWRALQRTPPEQVAIARMTFRRTVAQAESLRRRLVVLGGADPSDLATVTAYAGLLDTPRLLRPWVMLRHGIRRQRRTGPLWRAMARQILFIYLIMKL